MVKPVRIVDGQKVVLVPYDKEHVARYHEWLQDPLLLDATASEAISLPEHYELQQSWISDPTKCMFIILDKNRIEGRYEVGLPHVEAMAGDVNVFMNDYDDEHAAEIDIMVADPLSRGKGLAKESVQLMMEYASQQLQISKFRAKIDESNAASLHLFRTLGFQDVGYSAAFKQVTLELTIPGQ